MSANFSKIIFAKKILINNKQKEFLRLLNEIRINMLSHLCENKVHTLIPLNENIYDFVAEVIFVRRHF